MRVCGLTLALHFAFGCTSLPMPSELPAVISDEPADHLTLAAESLAGGDEPAAAVHFEAYVRAHPDQLMFRVHLADLLYKIHRANDAKHHYERFIADAQDSTGTPQSRLVHCHTRLMEIAQSSDDHFLELFHRGVGLLLLTRQDVEEAETCEEILCKAIATLLEAKELRPTDARVHVYLAEAHERAGNRRAADVSRATARNLMTPGAATTSELMRLEIARNPVSALETGFLSR